MSKPRPPQLTVTGIDTVITNGRTDHGDVLATPVSPGGMASPGFRKQRTLKQLWDAADQAFFEETGYRLESATPLHKNGVMQKWTNRYTEEKSETQKKLDKLTPILQNIVNGVEVVGAFAASAASAVFGPAQMCFNAITFVLDAPGKIKHVYDCLQTLFQEVQDFLVKFRVLERIDSKGRLDSELVDNANRLLIAFTKICGVATKLLKRKRTAIVALEAIFLTNDNGVSSALANFKELAVTQSQVIGAISLEHVLENEDLSRQILAGQTEMAAYLKSVASKESEEKTRIVVKQRISEIERKLFTRAELNAMRDLQQTSYEALPGTLDGLISTKEYTSWSNIQAGGQAVLHLSGEPGTGKSSLIESLRDFLEAKRDKMLKQGPCLYVAYHTFADRKSTVASKDIIAQALKSMAIQVANQSTRYTDKLHSQLKEKALSNDTGLIKEKNVKIVWDALSMFDFNPPDGSIMYLLFDGFQGDDGEKQIRRLTATLLAKRGSSSSFRVCILFAGTPSAMPAQSTTGSTANLVDMKTVNEDILRFYIRRLFQIHDCFQDEDRRSKEQGDIFCQTLIDSVEGNFEAAKQKVTRMRSALDDDATSAEIEQIIREDVDTTFDAEARDTLNDIAAGLSPKLLAQFKELLVVLLYGLGEGEPFDLSWLEAVLKVNRTEETLEPLAKKIRKRFSRAIDVSGVAVSVNTGIENYLRQHSDGSTASYDDSARLISLSINIQNAKKSEIQTFLLDLNAKISYDASIFDTSNSHDESCRIRISEQDARFDMTMLCLRAMNEETPKDGEKAVSYAFYHLPRMLYQLLPFRDTMSLDQKRQICDGLVAFLSDPYYLQQNQEAQGEDWRPWWFDYGDGPNTINTWLTDEDVLPKLQPTQRRWVLNASTRNDGRSDYLRDVAMVLAKEWRQTGYLHHTTRFYHLCSWIGKYVKSLEPPIDEDEEAEEEEEEGEAQVGTPEHSTEAQSPVASEHSVTQNMEKTSSTDAISEAEAAATVNGTGNGGSNATTTEVAKTDTTDAPVKGETIDEKESTEKPDTSDEAKETAAKTVETLELTDDAKDVLTTSEWTASNIPDAQDDKNYHYRVAITLNNWYEYAPAKEWFAKIPEDNPFYWRACVRIGLILRMAEDTKSEGNDMLKRGLEIARAKRTEDKLSELELFAYRQSLESMIEVLEVEAKDSTEIIDYYKEMLEIRSEDGESRWSLIQALCKLGREGEASEILDDWSNTPNKYGDQHPKDALLEIAASAPDNGKLRQIVEFAKDQILKDRVLNLFSEASAAASLKAEVLGQARLTYELSRALVHVAHDDSKAIQGFEDCLEITSVTEELYPQGDPRSWYLVSLQEWTVKVLCELRYRSLRTIIVEKKALIVDGTLANEETVRDEMVAYIRQTSALCTTLSDNLYCFVASLCRDMKKPLWAQDYLRQEIKDGVEVLSDDTPDNDPWGGSKLARAFACHGDDVNMRIAYSLIDRRARMKKLVDAEAEAEAAAKATAVTVKGGDADAPVNGVGEKAETGNTAENDEVAAESEEEVELPAEDANRLCNICRCSIESSDPAGFWICRSCDDTDFCNDCWKKFKEGEIHDETCHPTHDFVKFYHPVCPKEELEAEKVFIDWDIVYNEDGTFARTGGRLASLSEWVERIREQWNLPMPVSDGRIQQ